MKVGIISDTHDRIEEFSRAVKIFKEQGVGLVIHVGDWVSPYAVVLFAEAARELNVPIKGILGNNDGDHYVILKRLQKENILVELSKNILEIEVDRKKIVVYHGTDQALTDALIASKKYEIVITGHTHITVIKEYGEVLHINPGTLSHFADGKFIDYSTVAVYDTATHKAEIMQI